MSLEQTEMRKSKLTAVAEELRELDLSFKGGSDFDFVERGYAQKLIHAISSEDEVLECEALKSLGDVYLHKANIKKHKVENFNKACAFYEEHYRHYTSEEEKQVIQRRLKYAEKCTKLVHSQMYAKMEAQISGNITLAVAATLQEVKEKTKMKGRGMEKKTKMKRYNAMALIEGYTQSFVKAIVDKNKRLQVESLKSLGDLYLEKGRVGRDEAAFTTSAGLYRAALDRCEDSDGRETLKHRIKYAEKVKKKVRERQETRRPFDKQSGRDKKIKPIPTSRQTTQEDTHSTYQEHLQEGCRVLQRGDLDTAEEHFAAALINDVHVKDSNADQHRKEAEPLYKLSDVYLKRGMQSRDGGDFAKAAALCNAALVRARPEDREGIKESIQVITCSFLQRVLNIKQTRDISNSEKHKLVLKETRKYVEREIKRIEQQIDPYSLDDDDPKIREVEKKRAEAIKELCETIVEQRRKFIAGLVDECMEVMGPPPCKYAMIGLGSQATGLVTPYSDLEFAILVERETDNNVRYFRNLTHYLHLKVINLGETILPAMGIKSINDFSSDDPLDSWFYDSVTPRGFSFDGAMPHACKTPLGRGETCGLIHTPTEMTKLLKNDIMLYLKKGYHLASTLVNVALITGEQALVDTYTSLWTQLLQDNCGTIRLLIANTVLNENTPTFKIQMLTLARLLNVKKEIYRFSSLAVSCWALICNIQPTTIWETIQIMHANRVINSENAHHLMVLVSISAEMRLRTYMNNRGQVENMSALSSMTTSTGTDIDEQLKKVFYFSNTKQLMRYYYTERPLQLFISQLFNNKSPEEPASLFNNSPTVQAEIYKSLFDFQKAKDCMCAVLERVLSKHGGSAITAHVETAITIFSLGDIWHGLGNDRMAISRYTQSLGMWRSIYGENTAHPVIAIILSNLGASCNVVGEYRKAISYLEQSQNMMHSIYGEDTAHDEIAKTLMNLGTAWGRLAEYKKAITFFEQSLQIVRSIHGENNAHSDIAVIIHNLGTTWMELGDHRTAIRYYEQSLQMRRRIFGKLTAHPDIALSLHVLGTTWSKRGDDRKAINYYETSLQVYFKIFGEANARPDIARVLDNLGSAWGSLGVNSKALSYHVRSLKMRREVHGEATPHPDIAASLNNLGLVWRDLGDYRKALTYHEQSLQMRWSIHGENTAHPDIVLALSSLGAAWNDLGEHRKAIKYCEQALQMSQSTHIENTGHPAIVASLVNLGIAWRELGDHRRSVNYHEQALKMERCIHGVCTAHPQTAKTLGNLGVSWRGLNEYRKAISYTRQSLLMMRSIYGEDTAHPDMVKSLTFLGLLWSDLGDKSNATSYYEQALQMTRSSHGEDTAHSDIAKSLHNMGDVWCNFGDYRKAISYHEQALQMRRSIHGESTSNADIASSLNSLGIAKMKLGEHTKAVRCYEQSLQIRRSVHGEDTAHPDIAKSLNNLGITWGNFGDHKKAASYHEQSLQMSRRVHGEDTAHPDIAGSLNNLGIAYFNLSDHRKALSYYEQSLQMRRVVYGKNTAHRDSAQSFNNMGMALIELGDHTKAMSCLEYSLQMTLRAYGENAMHPDIAQSLNSIGFACLELGDYKKAVGYHEQSLKMRRSIYGEDTAHPDIAVSLNNLGEACRLTDDHKKAVNYFEQFLRMMRKIYGEKIANPIVAGALNNLGFSHEKLGNYEKAVCLYSESLEMARTVHGRSVKNLDTVLPFNNLMNALSYLNSR